MILASLLAADGHKVGACRWCGRVFARDLDHAGNRHAPQREFCSKRCRAVAAWHRRAPRVRHAKHWAALTQLHDLEHAGQQPLPGQDQLPEVPTYQEATA